MGRSQPSDLSDEPTASQEVSRRNRRRQSGSFSRRETRREHAGLVAMLLE